MVKHYSLDTRNICLRMRNQGLSYRYIQSLTGISKSTVHRWYRRRKALLPHSNRKKRKWTNEIAHQLRDILQKQPYCTLQSLQSSLNCSVSTSMLSRWLRSHLGFSRKRASKHFRVFNDNVRSKTDEFVKQMQTVDKRKVIAIDETSICMSDFPRYGYTPVGMPLVPLSMPQRKAKRTYTLVMAVSADAVESFQLIHGSCNASKFTEFIATLPNDRYLLMDNVAFHKTVAVTDAIHSKRCIPIFTPPYSPQFNPIELVFSCLKQTLRSHVAEHRSCETPSFLSLLEKVVTPTTLQNCFRHCMRLSDSNNIAI